MRTRRTLKQLVEFLEPDKVSHVYRGGVYSCPVFYSYLIPLINEDETIGCCNDDDCIGCWNRKVIITE